MFFIDIVEQFAQRSPRLTHILAKLRILGTLEAYVGTVREGGSESEVVVFDSGEKGRDVLGLDVILADTVTLRQLMQNPGGRIRW